MMISPPPEGESTRNRLISATAFYLDPRDLSPNSPVRDLARAYLQELRDKGRSDTTLPRYERFVLEFLGFIERDGAEPRARDLDVRILKAYGSHLARRRLRAGRDAG